MKSCWLSDQILLNTSKNVCDWKLNIQSQTHYLETYLSNDTNATLFGDETSRQYCSTLTTIVFLILYIKFRY